MMQNSYGPKQHVAIEGKETALAFAAALMEAHECSVLIQRNDDDIYIVSWANYYGYQQWLWEREAAQAEEEENDVPAFSCE